MNLRETYENTTPKMSFTVLDGNRLLRMAPTFEPKSVPAQMGSATSRSMNPWASLKDELIKALAQKLVNEEATAVLMGMLRMKVKAGTRITPVPIPRRPGKTPRNRRGALSAAASP